MNIQIDGHHTDLTAALRDAVMTAATNIQQHFEKMGRIHVSLTVEKNRKNKAHIAEIDIHLPHHNLCAKVESDNMYESIHKAFTKIEKQAMKFKARRKTKISKREINTDENMLALTA